MAAPATAVYCRNCCLEIELLITIDLIFLFYVWTFETSGRLPTFPIGEATNTQTSQSQIHSFYEYIL
jgi:hypothetical protein